MNALLYFVETIALATALACVVRGGAWMLAFVIGALRIWQRNRDA